MDEVILTPSLDLSGEGSGDQLAPAGDLGSLLPWNSEGYIARNSLPSAVGWIVIQKADGSLSYCSGTLVGVNVVLTAAHCLSSGSSYWFLPGEYGVLSGHPYWRASAHYWPPTYTSLAGAAAQPAFDYGVLILQADSQGRHAGSLNGWFPIYMYGPVSTAIAANQFLDSDWRRVSIGYPKEGWFQTYCTSGGCYPWQVDATQSELFTVGGGFYIIGWGGQSSGGNSGGGVFRNIDGRWYVVTMFTGTTNETTCLDAGFSTWSACGSFPDSNPYFGNKMWGPTLLNTAEPNYGFDDFWRAVFS